VNIYTLAATVGPEGILRVNGTDYAGILEFIGGTSVTLTPSPGLGYQLDEMTVGGAVISSVYTINADTTVVVTFKEKGVDPNVIWEWMYLSPEDGPQGGAFTNVSTGNYLVGTGLHPQAEMMPINAMGGAGNVTHVSGKGIQLNGSTATTAATLVIGNVGTNPRTATTSSTAPDGVFNFTENTAGHKITIPLAEPPTAATGNRSITIGVCHSNTAGTDGPLASGYSPSNAGRLFYYQNPWQAPGTGTEPSSGLIPGNNGAWNAATNTITLKYLDPSETAFPTSRGFLEKAWLGINVMGVSGTTLGASFIINSITIAKL
jgi:hypothetical protein